MSRTGTPSGAWFARLQRALPQHPLSRLTGTLARSRAPWIRRPFIHGFARAYGVDLGEAQRPGLDDYASFNDFFTRALRADARPVDADPSSLVSPADGTISQIGRLDRDRLLQAKGTQYRLGALLDAGRVGSDGKVVPDATSFHGGTFATIYLAPRDYHRVHAPAAGTLLESTAIPGSLFSVNSRTESAITDLFCRNERLVCRLQTRFGNMLVVLVGALIVASIATPWDGPRSPYRRREQRQHHELLDKGQELGRFLLGSTVIVCCEPGRLTWDADLRPGMAVRMGQRLGSLVG